MKCPICIVDLQMTERQGIEIDYCPKCRGVWLDRGELDKIVEKSSATTSASPVADQRAPMNNSQKRYDEDYHGDHGYDPRYGKKHKKESLLGDLFDF